MADVAIRVRLAPGYYQEGETLVIEVPELLEYLGLEDTLDNRQQAVNGARRAWARVTGLFRVLDKCPRCRGYGVDWHPLGPRLTTACTACGGSGEIRLE